MALEGQRGAVVALDPRSGEVLAMVSRPAFDPNAFAAHITTEYWKQLTSGNDNPMLNRAIQAQFAPGSTFKPIMALAGLETGTIDDHDTFHCPGGATFFGRFFKCWQKRGHGTVNVHLGIVQSCDVFFYNLGNKLGIDQIAAVRGDGGHRQENRDRSARRSRGPDAFEQMEAAHAAPEVVCRRDHFRRHRPGRGDGDAAATGGGHRRHRQAAETGSSRTW